ncbi:MAG TPA: glycosyltransferase family A protein [Nitrolancea sp.]|nr:glycosyltransferase family A protein [Nitrolancea sp.]
MALVDVLIPTCGRKTGLAVALTSLLGQTFTDFDVIVSDQTHEDESYLQSIEIDTVARALRWHGHQVDLHRHLPRCGMGEQRQFLLEQSRARYVYYLDDDVLLEPKVLERLLSVIQQEGCGFVGTAATGLNYLNDVRPHEQQIELWDGPVCPEPFAPDRLPWERHKINNAANPLHLERRLIRQGEIVRYKVAWVGGASALYDREKLVKEGGFSWWNRLPPEHAGEEVLAQFLLIRACGGCAVLPSGTYHLGLPTTIANRERNATELFADILREREAVSRSHERFRELYSSQILIPAEMTQ